MNDIKLTQDAHLENFEITTYSKVNVGLHSHMLNFQINTIREVTRRLSSLGLSYSKQKNIINEIRVKITKSPNNTKGKNLKRIVEKKQISRASIGTEILKARFIDYVVDSFEFIFAVLISYELK